MSPLAPTLRSYDGVAPLYDPLARLWSGGGIAGAGRAVCSWVRPGMSALVLGVGEGRDAAALAQAGAALTLVDLSPAMLDRAEARARAAVPDVSIVRVCGDALSLPAEQYDLVCTHYFLNVFGPGELSRVMDRVRGHVRPGGLWSIADFAPDSGWLGALHYRLPMEVFAAAGLCARHPVYDYEPLLPADIRIEAVVPSRVFGLGPAWHQTWICRRALDREDR